MDGSDSRHQRASLSFPYVGPFTDALSLDGSTGLDLSIDDAWKSLDLQSPTEHAFAGFHTSHDDLCAYTSKCPTAGLAGLAGPAGSVGGMPLHARQFSAQPSPLSTQSAAAAAAAGLGGFLDPYTASLYHGTGAGIGGSISSSSSDHGMFGIHGGSLFGQMGTASPATPGPYHHFDHDDFADQLSALSSPQHALPDVDVDGDVDADGDADVDDDGQSVCDSECGAGEICHDAACADPSRCCEDESCLQDPSPAVSGKAISSEDAIAAVALTSFVDGGGSIQSMQNMQNIQSLQQPQLPPQRGPQRQTLQQQQQQHHHTMSGPCSSACMDLSLGPDLCISPQFLMNYRHIREAHNPEQPTSCNASYCPIDDPSFYQECHIRHVMPMDQDGGSGSGSGSGSCVDTCSGDACNSSSGGGFFDNIDLSLMMGSDNSSGLGAVHECGAKFPNSEAMVQHFWNDHRASLAYANQQQQQQQQQQQHQQHRMHGMLGHVPGLISSTASSASLSSQDLLATPSTMAALGGPGPLSLPEAAASPTTPLADGQLARKGDGSRKPDVKLAIIGKGGVLPTPTDQTAAQKHECFWCGPTTGSDNGGGGSPCGQVFASAGDLHKHVLAEHTHQLKRDVGGTYSCGWFGCTRRDGEEKGGFAQKSKIDRHMQVHTGNKPFLCDICHQSFSANQALLQHKLIHEDSKPLSCDICGKTFRQHSALTMHIRTHTKVRPLKCPYCNKEFSESSNLSKHKRIHTGDGLYICNHPGCGKHFHRKDQLRRHSMQHSKPRQSISSSSPMLSPTPVPALK